LRSISIIGLRKLNRLNQKPQRNPDEYYVRELPLTRARALKGHGLCGGEPHSHSRGHGTLRGCCRRGVTYILRSEAPFLPRCLWVLTG